MNHTTDFFFKRTEEWAIISMFVFSFYAFFFFFPCFAVLRHRPRFSEVDGIFEFFCSFGNEISYFIRTLVQIEYPATGAAGKITFIGLAETQGLAILNRIFFSFESGEA